ncbi:MAG: hypothetical protein FJ197_01755 [Gammaproteobacteria bacterium]|nr:hypothetical protein [Gammaproteobacteria bacterium]
MICLYYLAPSLESTQRITDDLHAAGVQDFFLHVISRDESGLRTRHIHSSNYLETRDIIRDGFIGAALGLALGLVLVIAAMYFEPFGPGVPPFIFALIVGVITLFGAWEGGLAGIASENKKLAKFHHDLEAGRFLILIYARKAQGPAVRGMMRAKHPEAELAAADRHFINPFSKVRKRAHHRHGAAARGGSAQQSSQ